MENEMIIQLHDGTELELGDRLTTKGTLEISPDDMPGADGPGCAVYINIEDAKLVIAHLQAVFGIAA